MTRELIQQALEFCEFCWRDVTMNKYAFERLEKIIDTLREALAQPEQKPVGKLKPCKEGWFADIDNPPPLGAHESLLLYTEVQPPPKRQTLTDEQRVSLIKGYGLEADEALVVSALITAIEAKLGETK